MKRIDLVQVEHNVKVGQECPLIEPNVLDDCMFYCDGEPVGFYIKQMPERMIKIADVANAEFLSDNVPKSMLNRATAITQMSAREDIKEKYKDRKEMAVSQMSVILGSIPPKPMVRRGYPTISSVHLKKSANVFVKAMLMLCKESEKLIQEIAPDLYKKQKDSLQEVDKKWKFGELFTSSISNYNISAPFHRDTGNIVGAGNVIITKRLNAIGGNLHVPDYNATMDSANNSLLYYPAWRNVHGVTPIVPTHEGGYRNSLIFYPLKAFVGL